MIDENTVKYAQDGAAWKTRAMRGYVYKTVLPAETYGAGAYKLTFKDAGDPANTYDFYFNVDTTVYTGTIPDATNLTLIRELLGHVLNGSWQQGTVEEYEEARTGGGEW